MIRVLSKEIAKQRRPIPLCYRWFMANLFLKSSLLTLLLLVGHSSSVAASDLQSGHRFVTIIGTGPDKWGSIWLITRHLNPKSIEIVQSRPADVKDAMSFDYPGSVFNRTGERSTYSALVEQFSLNTKEVQALELMIKEIEFEPWNPDKSVASSVMEISFRNIHSTLNNT